MMRTPDINTTCTGLIQISTPFPSGFGTPTSIPACRRKKSWPKQPMISLLTSSRRLHPACSLPPQTQFILLYANGSQEMIWAPAFDLHALRVRTAGIIAPKFKHK